MSDTAEQAKEIAMKANARMDTHEAVCAERYKALDSRLEAGTRKMSDLAKGQDKIMQVLIWGGCFTLTTLVALTGWLGNKLADTVLK